MTDYNQQARNLRKPLAPYLLPFTEDNLGTYSPAYLGLGTPGATTYSLINGSYTRLGNILYVFGRVAWTAATGTGAATISLPMAAVFTRVTRFPVLLYPVGVTFTNGGITGVIDSLTSASFFVINSPATNAAGTLVAMEAAGDVAFSTMYEVA